MSASSAEKKLFQEKSIPTKAENSTEIFFVRKLCGSCFIILDEFTKYTGEDEFQWDWIQEWYMTNIAKNIAKILVNMVSPKCSVVRLLERSLKDYWRNDFEENNRMV